MANALLPSIEDHKQLELVNTVIEKTQKGKLAWNKSSTSYESSLPNGVQLIFALASAGIFSGKTWAHFVVRQRNGTEILKIEQSYSVVSGTGLDIIPKSSAETAVQRLFEMVSDSANKEVDSVIKELNGL
jgi:hypothetical protein